MRDLLFIVIIIIVTFTQGIYNYIPETNHVPTLYTVATILLLQYMVHVMLFPTKLCALYISTFRSKCAVPSVTVYNFLYFFPCPSSSFLYLSI